MNGSKLGLLKLSIVVLKSTNSMKKVGRTISKLIKIEITLHYKQTVIVLSILAENFI